MESGENKVEVAELRGPDSKFPIDVARKPRQLDAYQFGHSYPNEKFTFGMIKEDVAKAVREIADRIECGEYILQSGGVFTYAQRDDYVMTCLNIKFHSTKVAST